MMSSLCSPQLFKLLIILTWICVFMIQVLSFCLHIFTEPTDLCICTKQWTVLQANVDLQSITSITTFSVGAQPVRESEWLSNNKTVCMWNRNFLEPGCVTYVYPEDSINHKERKKTEVSAGCAGKLPWASKTVQSATTCHWPGRSMSQPELSSPFHSGTCPEHRFLNNFMLHTGSRIMPYCH